jgi:hypothetical protein
MVDSVSVSSLGPAPTSYPPTTTYTCPTVVHPTDSILAQDSQIPLLYFEQVAGQYAGVTELPQSEVTYFFLSDR